MKKRVVIWSSFMVIMLFGVFTMYVKAQTTTTYYLNNRNELFQGAPANSNCGEIAACIKTTTGITGSNISYNASKDQVKTVTLPLFISPRSPFRGLFYLALCQL